MTALQKIIGWIPALLDGAKITILLTLTSVAAGIVVGLFLSLGKMSKKQVYEIVRAVLLPLGIATMQSNFREAEHTICEGASECEFLIENVEA